MNSYVFTHEIHMIFDDFHVWLRHLFLHLFLMSFGIDVGSILAPLWH